MSSGFLVGDFWIIFTEIKIGHFDQEKLVLPDQSEEVFKLTKELVNLTNLFVKFNSQIFVMMVN